MKASVTTSNTVIIIPNNINNEDGLHDEKTIFATLTIKSIDSSIRVVAYLLERENLTHIKRAEADEVVISDDFSLNILASHVVDPGVPQLSNHLVNGLIITLRSKTNTFKLCRKQYGDLFDYFRGKTVRY